MEQELPRLMTKITKKLKTLTLEYGGEKIILDINDDSEINILEVDQFITQILKDISEKAMLRKSLLGGNDDSSGLLTV